MDERIKSQREQVVRQRIGREVPDAIRDLYEAQGLSQDEVAAALGVHRATVVRWMKDWGIQTRDRRAVPSEASA